MKRKFRISLDPRRQLIFPGEWPATVFGNRGYIEAEYETADEARHEIGDMYGINSLMLRAVERDNRSIFRKFFF